MLHGIDVASYQGANPDFSGCQVVAIKVSQGVGYVNPEFKSQLKDAREHGCRVVFYHYPEIAEPVNSQLSHFLGAIGSELTHNDVLCLDWEWYDQKGISEQQARDFKDQWITQCKNAKQNRCIVYCDLNNWKNVDINSNCGDGLWIADYTKGAKAPNVKHSWVGWQYADKPEDEDTWNFADVAAFDHWATANFKVPAPTTNTPVDVRSEAGFGVWSYKNPQNGPDAWSRLGELETLIKKIALHLGVE